MKETKNKGLFFYSIGCSFTWGQGLPFYRYSEKNGWSNKERDLKKTWWASNEYHMPLPDHWMTTDDYVYQFENRYSGLLAKKLKCEYSSKMENYGKNSISFEYLDSVLHRNQESIYDEKKLDFIILQLTMPERDQEGLPGVSFFGGGGMRTISYSKPKSTLEEVIDWTISEVFKLNTRCEENNIELFVWSWPYEFNILSTEDFWVSIIDKDRIYNSLEDLVYEGDPSAEGNFPKKEYSIPLDAHPNLKCHKIICDSIYTEIKERGIA